jgi:hypothetical protein
MFKMQKSYISVFLSWFGIKPKKHKHDWETVSENRWGLPTRQVCKCGLKRHVETHPKRMIYRWERSDGDLGLWLGMASGLPVSEQKEKNDV